MEMADRCDGKQAIFIVDRGFEGANLFECLKRKTKFLVRVKDVNCKT